MNKNKFKAVPQGNSHMKTFTLPNSYWLPHLNVDRSVDGAFSPSIRTKGYSNLEMPTHGFLPSLSTLEDAASFEYSVLPFYRIAMDHVSQYLNNPPEIYSTTNPFVLGSVLSVVSSLTVFVVSLSTGNWSWYLLGKDALLN
jgi:hypothetical protein